MTHTVVDFYDDGGQTLREVLRDTIPDFIKEAEVYSEDELARFPDHAFAVVLVGGDRPLRKLACVDKAHAAISAIYLMEHSRNLPYEARGVAAHNTKVACESFGLATPGRLAKMAARAKKLIEMDGVTPIVKKEKRSEISGTNISPLSYGRTKKLKKLSSGLIPPYVDIARDVQPTLVQRDRTTYALDDEMGPQLPIDTFDQVKEAAEFFAQQGKRFHPRRRHEACVKIAQKADLYGVELDSQTRHYGSTTYAEDGHLAAGIETRRQAFREADDSNASAVLDSLMQKRASAHPEEFAEALAEFDISMGLSRYWDKSVMDPWFTTFGPEKMAEWSWEHNNEKVTASQLKALLNQKADVLKRSFGDEMVDAMRSQPTEIFDSLPLGQKVVIARMAYQL